MRVKGCFYSEGKKTNNLLQANLRTASGCPVVGEHEPQWRLSWPGWASRAWRFKCTCSLEREPAVNWLAARDPAGPQRDGEVAEGDCYILTFQHWTWIYFNLKMILKYSNRPVKTSAVHEQFFQHVPAKAFHVHGRKQSFL